MSAVLIEPSRALTHSFQDALAERGTHLSNEDVSEYVAHSKDASLGLNLRSGEVVRTEYWLQEGEKYIGRIQIRKKPSGRFPDIASHVYYEVRPSEQGKGYGNLLLSFGILKARHLGMNELLIVCDESNTASRKIIERNGGILKKRVPVPDSPNPTLVYAIEL